MNQVFVHLWSCAMHWHLYEVISKFDNFCFLFSTAHMIALSWSQFYYTLKILGFMVHSQLKCGTNMAATGIIGQIVSWKIGMAKLTNYFQRTPTFVYSLVPLSKNKSNALVTMAKSTDGQSPPLSKPSKPKYKKLEERLMKAQNRHLTGVINTDQLLKMIQHVLML